MHKHVTNKILFHLLSRFSLLSSFQDSNEYGIREPLQSKNDIAKMAPFNLKIVAPTKETTTGWEDRLSGSGGVIRIVKTDPKLVPTHRVGVSTVGSKNHRLIKGNVFEKKKKIVYRTISLQT